METASQILVCSLLGGVSAFITHVLNRTKVQHEERFLDAYSTRRPGQGIVTVCNHVTAVDDPGALLPIVPPSWLLQPGKLRWTLCAHDRCFTNPVTSAILTAGRALPVERGAGPLQPLMDNVVAKLDAGDWVHMFPEGSRRRYEDGIGRMRPGVGRLIADAKITPVVVPFYHRGLHMLLRKGEYLPIAFGHKIDIVVGEPIPMEPLLAELRRAGVPEREVHVAVAERIGDALRRLRDEVEGGGAGSPSPPAMAAR